MAIRIRRGHSGSCNTGSLLVRMSGILLLGCVASGAHAASIYKCVDAHGRVAFRDMPCATHAQQRKIDVQPQPLIGAPGEHLAQAAPATHGRKTVRARKTPTRAAHAKPETSWECRAADGEVFYRHARCPSSIPGDGVVRGDYAETQSGKRSRGHDAWGRVRVHGKKVLRAEACRRIHSVGAAGRDGRAHDETVSTYDHLMGRDPCGG